MKTEYKYLTTEHTEFLYKVLDVLKKWHMGKSKMYVQVNKILKSPQYNEHDRRYLSNEVTEWYKKWRDIETWYYKNLYGKKFHIVNGGFSRVSDELVYHYEEILGGVVKIGYTRNGVFQHTEYYMSDIVKKSKKDWKLL